MGLTIFKWLFFLLALFFTAGFTNRPETGTGVMAAGFWGCFTAFYLYQHWFELEEVTEDEDKLK